MKSTDDIRVSVALVTRNRPESLSRCLSSWKDQRPQPFEIVISDDSDDQFRLKNKQIAERYQTRWMIGPRKGLYANRNHVVTACRGTHIRSADDDHEFPRDHFRLCLDAVRSDPCAIWIIGEYCPPVDTIGKCVPPCPGQLHPRGFSEAPLDVQNSWALSDGASIFPRLVFDRGLRYADRFMFGAAYLEFGSLLHAYGFRIRHLEGTYVIHHYNARTRSFMSDDIELGSRLFAMLCHSFIYQPTLNNRLLTSLECIRQIASNGRRGIQCFRGAMNAFRSRRQEFMRLSNHGAMRQNDYLRERQDSFS